MDCNLVSTITHPYAHHFCVFELPSWGIQGARHEVTKAQRHEVTKFFIEKSCFLMENTPNLKPLNP